MKIWKSRYFGQKIFFSKKIFFNYFSTLISNMCRKIFFPRFEYSSSDVFKAFFRKNAFFNIFLNIEPRTVKFGQDPLFLMLFTKKWQNSKKNIILTLFGKIRFLVNFRNPKIFLGYHRFPITRVLINSLMQKNLKKIDFGGMR